MESLSTYFLKGFGVTPNYRPANMENIITGLVYTLAKNGMLPDAIKSIEKYTNETFDGNLTVIDNITTDEAISYLSKDEAATALYLAVYLVTLSKEEHIVIDNTLMLSQRKFESAMYTLNSLDLGFKVYPESKDTIGIICYDDLSELPLIVAKYKLSLRATKRIFT